MFKINESRDWEVVLEEDLGNYCLENTLIKWKGQEYFVYNWYEGYSETLNKKGFIIQNKDGIDIVAIHSDVGFLVLFETLNDKKEPITIIYEAVE